MCGQWQAYICSLCSVSQSFRDCPCFDLMVALNEQSVDSPIIITRNSRMQTTNDATGDDSFTIVFVIHLLGNLNVSIYFCAIK